MNTTVTALHIPLSGSVTDRVLGVIAHELNRDPAELRPDATLEALNVDSVDVVMILNGIEEEFQVYLPVEQGFAEVKCLQDFVSLVAEKITQQP